MKLSVPGTGPRALPMRTGSGSSSMYNIEQSMYISGCNNLHEYTFFL